MKQILASILLAVFLLGLVLIGLLIWQFDGEWTIGQGRAYFQENLPRLQEMAREAMQQLGRGIRSAFQLLQNEFRRCSHYGAGIPPQLCDSLQRTFGEDQTGWWCVICPVLEKVENFFGG